MSTARLNDNFHSMWCRIRFGEGHVIQTDAGFSRAPTTVCQGAAIILQELVGHDVDATLPELYRSTDPRQQCTHLFDLAVLTIALAGRGVSERRYEALIPDTLSGETDAILVVDGSRAARWKLVGEEIVAPTHLAGQHAFKGFFSWAFSNLEGAELIDAIMLQKALFLSRARRLMLPVEQLPLSAFPERRGVCYAYSAPQIGFAKQVGNYEVDDVDW